MDFVLYYFHLPTTGREYLALKGHYHNHRRLADGGDEDQIKPPFKLLLSETVPFIGRIYFDNVMHNVRYE